MSPEAKITEEQISEHWPYHIAYLAEILNGEYRVEDARKDLWSLIDLKKSEPRKEICLYCMMTECECTEADIGEDFGDK